MPLEFSNTTEEKTPITCTPVDALGKPANLDGALRVTVTSGSGTFTQDPATPLSFFAVSPDAPGDTTYLVEGDADLGAGVQLIQDTVLMHSSNPLATSLGLAVGPSVPKP